MEAASNSRGISQIDGSRTRLIASWYESQLKVVCRRGKMTRKILLVGMVLLLAGIALAKEGKSVKLTGYIIDNACAAGRATGDNAADKVKNHTVKCAMMPNCAKTGHAVFSDNNLYNL